MHPDQTNFEGKSEIFHKLNQVTPLSKYIAIVLFVTLPFVGGWIGYISAPEKIIEVQGGGGQVVEQEVEVAKIVDEPAQEIREPAVSEEIYLSSNGYSLSLPPGVSVQELTRYQGDFGSLCISPSYGCGGVGLQGWTPSDETFITADGTVMELTLWNRGKEIYITLESLQPVPSGFDPNAQIQLITTQEKLSESKQILSSIVFGENSMGGL